jgi:hypothetical protein
VYEVDADKLYQAAFAYRAMDQEGAHTLASVAELHGKGLS